MFEDNLALPPPVQAGAGWDELLRNTVAGAFNRYADARYLNSINRNLASPVVQGVDGTLYEAGKSAPLAPPNNNLIAGIENKWLIAGVIAAVSTYLIFKN